MGTTGLSITLANSIIGVGILAMPFCFQQCGVLLATVILLSMGLMSRLCCYFLLKSAILARRRNFEYLAFHVFGPVGKLAVEIGIIGFLMGTCIAYFVVVGDLGPQIISKIFNINQSDILRTSIMVIVSLVCVLPLGLLRNVDSLSNVSAATIGFYFCLVIKVIAEAATQLPSGQWHNLEMWKPSGVLQCMPIFSMALFCQTQLFEIFESLPSLSLEKMNVVTKNAINICTCVYFTLGLFGFIAFSQQEISGNILMSLSPTMASDVIKLGFVMSLAFSFPLIIFPCRASLYSLLYKKVHSSQHDHIINHSIPETTFRCITVGIVAVSLFISLLIPNIELVLGLVGSTIGVIICVLFPAACFVNLTFKNTNERVLAKGVLVFGLIIMVLGTYANLQAAENKIDKYDERYITQERIDKIVEDFFEKRGKNEDILKPVKNINSDNNKNMLRDSEVQPPNPVPPESHSNEVKSPEPANENKIKNDNLLNDVLLPEKLKEEAADRNDRVSESHPKNLKGKLNDAKLANEDSPVNVEEKQKLPSNEEIKNEKINILKQQQLIETMKQHGEEQKELLQEQKEILDEIIKNKNEEKIEKEANIEKAKEEESNKQQQLIETIKQHGEEQKELMKEQKEILNEIIKTKKELQQNKEAENNEAKKIAVESIKQIANIAIQSIGGATDKPIVKENEDKKADILEKLTNEAVQEIAKKAVETIEAIQEIKEEPKVVEEVKVDNKQDNEVIQNNNNLNAAPIENIAPLQNIAKLNPPQKHEEKQETQNDVKIQENKETDKQIDINVPVENIVQELKTHSHSPDEPQSYKVGEDTEAKENENKLNKNLPIPLAMNSLKVQNGVIQNTRENPVVNDLKMENAKEKQEPIQRQKREVVDCTKKQIDERDRKICDSLVIPKLSDKNVPKINVIDKSSILPKLDIHEKPEILPKVDLNDELSRLPIDPIHISRSLKSYKEER